ncbi:multidrug effflux MFS transporter [Microbacterium sp. P5_E9]
MAAPTAAFFVVLGFVQALWPLTMDLYLPAFPAIEQDLRTTPQFVSLTLTGAFVGMAVGQLTAGPLSDRVGRMRPLLAVLAVYAVATVGCALAPSVDILIACRVVEGVGSAASSVIVLAIVRDCAAGPRMVLLLARLQLVNGTFVVTAPALGAMLLQVMSWRGLFWILVGFGGALLVIVSATVARRETLPRERRRPPALQDLIGDYQALFRDRDYLFPLAANTLLWAGMMGYMASSSFLFQEVLGLDGGMYAVVFGGHGAVMILAAQLSARLTNRQGLRPVVAFGACGVAISALALIVSAVVAPGALWAFLVPLFGFTASFGVLSPCLQAGALQHHGGRAGTAASLLGAVTMIAGAVAAPIVAAFGVESTRPAAIFLASCALGAVAVVVGGRQGGRVRSVR